MGTSKVVQPEALARSNLRPIVGLTEGLPKNILEAIVIEAILKHRYFRDIAELRQEEARQCPACDDSVGPARIAYIRAMIDTHAQQAVLSALLDVLGYVPATPAD